MATLEVLAQEIAEEASKHGVAVQHVHRTGESLGNPALCLFVTKCREVNSDGEFTGAHVNTISVLLDCDIQKVWQPRNIKWRLDVLKACTLTPEQVRFLFGASDAYEIDEVIDLGVEAGWRQMWEHHCAFESALALGASRS